MNWETFITCAVTGAGDTVGKSPHVPVTPEQIAASALDAARAGAAVVHIHVRDPHTGVGSRDVDLYREVVDRWLVEAAARCRRRGANYQQVLADEPIADVVLRGWRVQGVVR